MIKVYKKSLGLILALVCCFSSFAQNNFFNTKNESAIQLNGKTRSIIPTKFKTVELNNEAVKSFLWSLPNEKNIGNNFRQTPVLEIPMPNGSIATFNVWQIDIQSPELAAKFPTIKTFAGQGITDPYSTIWLDYGPRGLHAQILTVNGSYYIDPYAVGDINNYISYYRKDLGPKGASWACQVPDFEPTAKPNPTQNTTAAACRGTEMRTYRLAVACTGEYAQAPGINAGTNPAILHQAIVTSVTRVVGVYRTDLSISMTLVATNNLVEFLNAATDPFSGNNNANVLINESQTVCDNFIGSANYDIGHTFSTGGGGLAQLNSPCGSSKARGITGSGNPTGDGYDIDYVAHEMGHQFGGNHTMAGCGSSPTSTKLEVGSGTTIQAYAGICGAENIQPNSDPFFHAKSFDEISNFVSGTGSGCGTTNASGNQIPIISSLPNNNLNIPISTPFTLSGTATDPDGDAMTYCWEQWDFSGTAAWNAGATAAAGNTVPLFKSRLPKTSGVRTFPDIAVILAGYPASPASAMNGLKGETLSPVSRAMKFKLTVRDNKVAGGGIASSGADGCQSTTVYQINVINTTTPFAVTAPNGGETYAAGSTQTITWNTVGTENAPISVANVRITLSTDGGLTYPTEIIASTPNDGSEALTIPAVPASTTARVRVEAVGNIFFDISNANFNITAVTNGFNLGTPAPVSVACPAPATMAITLTTSQIGTFTNPISFVATGNPGGTTVSFSPTTVTAGNSTTVTLNNTNTLAPGSYPITVTASASGAANVIRTLTYTITPTGGPAITAQPAAQIICAGGNTSFSVESATATAFQWQLSTNGGANYTNLSNTGVYSGATTATLTITGATSTLNTYLYRCVASVTCGSTNSNGALLTVNTAPLITINPIDVTTCAGNTVNFTTTATGTSLTHQWQLSTDGGANYNNLANGAPYAGVTTPTLTVTGVTAGLSGYRYRCVVSGTCPSPVNSTGAILTIVTSVTVTAQPSNATACENAGTSFTTAGSGSGVIYQWQLSTDGGANYNNLSNGAPYSGVNTATLTITSITAVMNNYRYRCVLSGTCTPAVNSGAATLNVVNPVNVTVQPTNKTVCATLNTNFSVTATSTETITYQWQVSTDGGVNYTNVPNTGVYTGATTPTLTITGATIALNNNRYRIQLNNVTCAVAAPSNVVTLTVNALPVVTWPNALANQCANATTYALTGGLPAGGTYKGIGVTGTNFNASVAGIGTKTLWYIFTNGNGCTDSISKTIVVNAFPTLSLAALSTNASPATTLSLLPGWTTTITATMSTGPNATYVWQLNTTNINNASNNYLVNVDRLGEYTVVGTSDLGCTSLPAKITVKDSASTKLFIYPSPNNGRFSVAYYNPGGASVKQGITIYSSLGKKVYNNVYTITQPWKNINIDLRNHGAGVYYVVIRDANGKQITTGEVLIN